MPTASGHSARRVLAAPAETRERQLDVSEREAKPRLRTVAEPAGAERVGVLER
jgi:hypothetical protein